VYQLSFSEKEKEGSVSAVCVEVVIILLDAVVTWYNCIYF
jgi:hypothetical protein